MDALLAVEAHEHPTPEPLVIDEGEDVPGLGQPAQFRDRLGRVQSPPFPMRFAMAVAEETNVDDTARRAR